MAYFTVIEMPHYLKKAEKLLTDQQRTEITLMMAKDPELGDVMAGTGGVRKFRYAGKQGHGKSGGERIIYLALLGKGRVYLLDIYAKNAKGNLSSADKATMAKFAGELKGA